MSFIHAHLKTALHLIENNDGRLPFAIFAKQYFAQHKKYGSKDRKNILQIAYAFYRTCRLFQLECTEVNLQKAVWLCSHSSNVLLNAINVEWNALAYIDVAAKKQQLQIKQELQIFPWVAALSKQMDEQAWQQSFLLQPHLFLRIRKNATAVIKLLQQQQIPYQQLMPNCLALPSGQNAANLLQLNKDVVVQDYASQQISTFFEAIVQRQPSNQLPKWQVWDCCAASGGKSILAKDILKHIQLTVSDVRESILINLRKRFAEAGIHDYNSFVADVSNPADLHDNLYNIIICDVPCSGSGTWARTPENLFFFKSEKIAEFSSLQKKISANAARKLASNGYFLYITCSVFDAENEQVCTHLQQLHPHWQIVKQEMIIGYHQQADTMFATLFYNP